MISAFQIMNFKCFEDLKLELGQLTLLTGFNGGGKSTAIQPLLLLAQNIGSERYDEQFELNGPLVQLGTIGDVVPAEVMASPVKFVIEEDRNVAISWSFAGRAGQRFLKIMENDTEQVVPNTLSFKEVMKAKHRVDRAVSRLIYISAVRGGAAAAYPSPNAQDSNFSRVGTEGQYAPYWYDQFVDDEVVAERRHPNESAPSFRKQLDAWMGELFPGAQANVQGLAQISMLSLQFRLSEIGAWRRPANIGYGLTYAFPILVALLAASKEQIIVIDSPEAHLHPSAQSRMGRILAHFAEAGIQIVVETHSDHLLNGARIAIKEGQLEHSSLRVHFFTGPTSTEHGVISPSVDSDGRIYEWPSGFFDQSEKDLSLLAGW